MKEKYKTLFNKTISGTPLDFYNELLPMISDYLTEINCEKSKEIISLIVQNPQLASQTIPTIVQYFCRKYDIYYISLNGKILCYYD